MIIIIFSTWPISIRDNQLSYTNESSQAILVSRQQGGTYLGGMGPHSVAQQLVMILL